MGRPRKPNHIKQLQGTNQPCRLAAEHIAPPPPTKITAPRELTGVAKKIYLSKAEQLNECGALSVMDLDALYLYATNMEVAIKAYKELSSGGYVVWVTNAKGEQKQEVSAWHKVMLDSIKVVNAIGQQLGYTPVSRQRIAQLGGETKDDDPFAEYDDGY